MKKTNFMGKRRFYLTNDRLNDFTATPLTKTTESESTIGTRFTKWLFCNCAKVIENIAQELVLE